jgi:hypothetical protein
MMLLAALFQRDESGENAKRNNEAIIFYFRFSTTFLVGSDTLISSIAPSTNLTMLRSFFPSASVLSVVMLSLSVEITT